MYVLTPFLIWLFCVGIAALAIGLLIKNMNSVNVNANEGFDSIIIKTCPATTSTYITSIGDTNCCNGDIVDGRCNGTDICSLSPTNNGGNGIMSCSDWIKKEWQTRSTRFCAPSIPYYFGTIARRQGDEEGCSASRCSLDGTAPQDTTKPTCRLYKTSDDEYGKVDSCFNIKARDAMAIPVASATRAINPTGSLNGKILPATFSATYLPPYDVSNGPVTCYDWERYKIYLTAVGDNDRLRTYEFNHAVNVLFCGANKAYYIDHTLSRADAVGLPPLPPPPPPAYIPPPPAPPPPPPAIPFNPWWFWGRFNAWNIKR